MGGAFIITLYKGPPLLHLQMDQIQGDTLLVDHSSKKVQNWTVGCLYLIGHCLSWAGWIVFQVLSMIMTYANYLNQKFLISHNVALYYSSLKYKKKKKSMYLDQIWTKYMYFFI